MHAADLPDPGSLVKQLEDLVARGPAAAPAGNGAASAPAAAPQALDWAGLVEQVEQSGQLRLAQVMHDWVRVVALAPGELTYALVPGYPGDATAELRDALLRATGERWQVTRAEGDAQPSLKEAKGRRKGCGPRGAAAGPAGQCSLCGFPQGRTD
jgi:DNA polymerase III subunit gamma/tau